MVCWNDWSSSREGGRCEENSCWGEELQVLPAEDVEDSVPRVGVGCGHFLRV